LIEATPYNSPGVQVCSFQMPRCQQILASYLHCIFKQPYTYPAPVLVFTRTSCAQYDSRPTKALLFCTTC